MTLLIGSLTLTKEDTGETVRLLQGRVLTFLKDNGNADRYIILRNATLTKKSNKKLIIKMGIKSVVNIPDFIRYSGSYKAQGTEGVIPDDISPTLESDSAHLLVLSKKAFTEQVTKDEKSWYDQIDLNDKVRKEVEDIATASIDKQATLQSVDNIETPDMLSVQTSLFRLWKQLIL